MLTILALFTFSGAPNGNFSYEHTSKYTFPLCTSCTRVAFDSKQPCDSI